MNKLFIKLGEYPDSLVAKAILESGIYYGYTYTDDTGKEIAVDICDTKEDPRYCIALYDGIYIINQNYKTHLVLQERTLVFSFIEPLYTKYTADGKYTSDLSFYITQALNLCDNVLVERVACSEEKVEEKG